MKKSLEELKAIRKKKFEDINLRKGKDGYRVVVGMATCGIAAGARPVMLKIMEEIENRNLTNVTVAQTGCIGVCRLEPILNLTLGSVLSRVSTFCSVSSAESVPFLV